MQATASRSCGLPAEIIEDRRFADLGGMALAGSPAEFGRFIADANIKAP
jgi:hypothetical protein